MPKSFLPILPISEKFVLINYFEIPLVFAYQWKKLSLEVGPAVSVLASSSVESFGVVYESNPPFYSFNVSGILGVNWHFTPKFHINFRVNNSLSVIRPSRALAGVGPNAIQIGSLGLRNQVLSFALVYRLTQGI